MNRQGTSNNRDQILAESVGETPGESNAPRWGSSTEARAIAKSRHAARMARLRDMVPERTWHMIQAIPATYQGRFAKARLGETSTKQMIRAHCESCVGYEDTKLRVGKCAAFGCALWTARPYQLP